MTRLKLADFSDGAGKWQCRMECEGSCCRSISNLKVAALAFELGWEIPSPLDRGDGTCKHLDDDGLCSIYETRPDICDVRKVAARLKELGKGHFDLDRDYPRSCLHWYDKFNTTSEEDKDSEQEG